MWKEGTVERLGVKVRKVLSSVLNTEVELRCPQDPERRCTAGIIISLMFTRPCTTGQAFH